MKANGYGHGAVLVANAALAGGATSLAVALVDEGLELRHAGVTAPILLLAEIPAETIPDALGDDITLTIGSVEGARAVRRTSFLHTPSTMLRTVHYARTESASFAGSRATDSATPSKTPAPSRDSVRGRRPSLPGL